MKHTVLKGGTMNAPYLEEAQLSARIGQNLLRLRKLSGMSQTQLGDAIGLSFQQIQKYENGKNRFPADKLFLVAQVLKVDISEFFEGIDASQITEDDKLSPEQMREHKKILSLLHKSPNADDLKTARKMLALFFQNKRQQ